MKKWQHRARMTCMGVLLLAVVFRLGSSAADLSVEKKQKAVSFLLYLQTGRAARFSQALPPEETEAPEKPTTPSQTECPSATEDHRETVPMTFSQEDADALSVKYAGEYRPDLEELLLRSTELDFSGEEPRILIVHTHATESYTQAPGWEYEDLGNYRTLDENHNMLRVGRLVADILNEAGVVTLHDKTLHDYPSYNGSYTRSLATIQGYLERYPSIQMVIDVHRDAIEDDEGNQMSTAFSLEEESSARIMLVVGTDEGGLFHPNWQENLSWALKIQAGMERLYPGLPRTLSLRDQRFNQHMTPGSVLVEIGTAGDTLEQALRAAERFAHTLVALMTER